jgi:hypothetical protein
MLLGRDRAGQLLKEMAERGEREDRGRRHQMSQAATLTDLGVSRTQSSRWQKLADLDEDDFEARTATAKKQAVSSPISRATGSRAAKRVPLNAVGTLG